MKALIFVLLLTMAAATTAQAQAIGGDWQGTLAAGGAEIRLVLHLTPDGKSGFTATFDSPDQGVKGLGVTSVTLVDSTLKFEVPQVRGSYEGKVNTEATAITGKWSQLGTALPLNLSRPPASSTVKRIPKPSDIDGDWEGSLNAGAVLRIVLHVQTFEDGISATLDSPDQKMFGAPATSITRSETKVTFEMKQLAGSFSGTLDPGLITIDGTWTQLGNSLPLVLKRVRRNP
jgi:hypothetical protein